MRIGEVSALSGVSVRMLRHYDALGLVRPRARTSAGYREYSDGDLRRILHVEALRALGLSLGEVSSALEDPAFAPAATVEDLIRRTRERIAAEEELLRRLQGIAAAEPSGVGGRARRRRTAQGAAVAASARPSACAAGCRCEGGVRSCADGVQSCAAGRGVPRRG